MSVLPPRPLLAIALLLLGGLAWTVDGRAPPQVDLADAARWEGQAVVVEGWAQSVRTQEGSLRFALAEGGNAVAVRVAGGPDPGRPSLAAGDRVTVEGRLLRSPSGDLQLLADGAAAVRRVAGGAVAEPGWDAVAAEPAAWAGRPLRLTGIVARGELRSEGYALRAGTGPWPDEGAVAVEGFLRYDGGCLCFAFDAVAVRPWTP